MLAKENTADEELSFNVNKQEKVPSISKLNKEMHSFVKNDIKTVKANEQEIVKSRSISRESQISSSNYSIEIEKPNQFNALDIKLPTLNDKLEKRINKETTSKESNNFGENLFEKLNNLSDNKNKNDNEGIQIDYIIEEKGDIVKLTKNKT